MGVEDCPCEFCALRRAVRALAAKVDDRQELFKCVAVSLIEDAGIQIDILMPGDEPGQNEKIH